MHPKNLGDLLGATLNLKKQTQKTPPGETSPRQKFSLSGAPTESVFFLSIKIPPFLRSTFSRANVNLITHVILRCVSLRAYTHDNIFKKTFSHTRLYFPHNKRREPRRRTVLHIIVYYVGTRMLRYYKNMHRAPLCAPCGNTPVPRRRPYFVLNTIFFHTHGSNLHTPIKVTCRKNGLTKKRIKKKKGVASTLYAMKRRGNSPRIGRVRIIIIFERILKFCDHYVATPCNIGLRIFFPRRSGYTFCNKYRRTL